MGVSSYYGLTRQIRILGMALKASRPPDSGRLPPGARLHEYLPYSLGREVFSRRTSVGITGKLCEIADIVALIEAKDAEKPMVCGTYKKRS